MARLDGFGVVRVDNGWGATRVVITVMGWVLARDGFRLRDVFRVQVWCLRSRWATGLVNWLGVSIGLE